MAERIFCTYFDSHFLTRGMALYRSLERNCPAFTLWIICCDDLAYTKLTLLGLRAARLVRLDELEQHFPALAALKPGALAAAAVPAGFDGAADEIAEAPAGPPRTLIEYYFTLTPFVPRYVFEQDRRADLVTYVDADIGFFSSPEPVFAEIGAASVAITEHRYVPEQQFLNDRDGRFNVGWVSFRRDADGLACLDRWCAECLEWCYDRAEDGKFGDQKYLNVWPADFAGTHIIQHLGVNVATWNIKNYKIWSEFGRLWVAHQPLVCYHYHGFKQKTPWLYDTNAALHAVCPNAIIRREIYGPYIRTNVAISRQLGVPIGKGIRNPRDLLTETADHHSWWQQARWIAKKIHVLVSTVLCGQQVIIIKDRVL